MSNNAEPAGGGCGLFLLIILFFETTIRGWLVVATTTNWGWLVIARGMYPSYMGKGGASRE